MYRELKVLLRSPNKILISILFLMTIINVLGQIERYELVELNNKKVYFPKENKAYIEELLESKDPDKLLYIADFYTEFHEDELAYYYFNSYTGYNSEFKARIANKLGVELATKELQTESYVEEEKYKEYNKISSLNEIETYFSYFKNGGIEGRNVYEKLYRYKFEGNKEEFDKLCKALLEEATATGDEGKSFVINLLLENYEAAKKFVESKPKFFIEFIKYLEYKKVDTAIIKKYTEEFTQIYSSVFEKDILFIRLNFTDNKDEKIKLLEDYLSKSFDKEAFEKYFELARNKEELKKYLINLVFQQTQEKYINYLIEIDKTYETQEKLESLFDKTYYFKYLEKNNQLIPIKHRNQYITYLYNAKKYDKLLEYKEFLNLDMFKFLGNNEYKVEVVEIIRKNYPLEIEYADLEKIEYFYFNEKHIFDEDLVKELLREKQLSPVETYYLSRYYGNLGEKEKALELEYALKGNYNLKFIED